MIGKASYEFKYQLFSIGNLTQFDHQMACVTGHVVYSWIFLDAGLVFFFSHSPLRSEDRLARVRKSHLTKRVVSLEPAVV